MTQTRISVQALADSSYQLSIDRFDETVVVSADDLRYALRLAYYEAAEGLIDVVRASGSLTQCTELNDVQIMALGAFFRKHARARR